MDQKTNDKKSLQIKRHSTSCKKEKKILFLYNISLWNNFQLSIKLFEVYKFDFSAVKEFGTKLVNKKKLLTLVQVTFRVILLQLGI